MSVNFSSLLRFALATLCLAVPAVAQAEETQPPASPTWDDVAADAPKEDAPPKTALDAQAEVAAGSAVLLGAALRIHHDGLVAGAVLEGSSTIFGYDAVTTGLLAGYELRPTRSWRFGAFVEGGERFYARADGSIFGPPGVSAQMPYLGVRANVAYVFKNGFSLGGFGLARTDLERRTVTYTYWDDGWFDSGSGQSTATAHVGTVEAVAGVQLGWEWAL